MSDLLRFAENELQLFALGFMTLVYVLRIRWLLRFKAGKERQAATGRGDTNPNLGIVYSWANIAMPWAMESTRQKFVLYLQFVVFHLSVAASIAMSFVIPYFPRLMEFALVTRGLQACFGAACLIGCYRLFRRLTNPVMKRISTPDDFFSLLLLTVWFLFALLAAPNRPAAGETPLLVYFIMTAFFLMYVPFSKISHYLYYPFTRYYFGKSMGHRGVYPLRRGPQAGAMRS